MVRIRCRIRVRVRVRVRVVARCGLLWSVLLSVAVNSHTPVNCLLTGGSWHSNLAPRPTAGCCRWSSIVKKFHVIS